MMNEKAQQKLIKALTQFTSIGKERQQLRQFQKGWPKFFPAEVYDTSQQLASQNPYAEHPFGWYRDQLRKVWAGLDAQGARLSVLVGLQSPWFNPALEETHPLAEVDPTFQEDANAFVNIANQIMLLHHRADKPDPIPLGTLPVTKQTLMWRTGDIEYEPQSEFSKAVFWLFKNSWRAKLCAECASYFVAKKASERYCSRNCRQEAQRRTKLRWWKAHRGRPRTRRNKKASK